MKIGVDYYPEQWDKCLWRQDADRMRKAGVSVVRMGEFAWSRLEPREGEYNFSWLDEIIAIFQEREIEVFLGTPTNTPPLWLYEKYPEVIRVGTSGQRIPIGIRGHRCLNNSLYRKKCGQIVTQMVSRYAKNPMVIGYQIDNELEANYCCCPVCEDKFRNFVKQKYGTVERVNEAYGNVVWSGEYSSFSQIKPPFGEHQTWLNPSYMLDFNHFASNSTVEYVEFQRKLIRQLDSEALITTNSWLCENMPDFFDVYEKLDFVSYDNYPVAVLPADAEELYSHAFHLDLMRGIKRKNFWIMEQLSGSLGGWMPMQPTLQPGMLKGYSLQAIAHGADAVLHFRWRTAIEGAEMFWHGLIGHDNVPGRRYQEFCDLCKTVETLKDLEGSVIRNHVAILYSSEQEYGFKIQPQAEGMHYFTQLKAYHDAFTSLGLGVDVIDWRSDISGYDIVVAPTIYITGDGIRKKLEEFAANGGNLLLTNRSGVKDEFNKCIMAALPTVFTDMAGVVVKEYNPIGQKKEKIQIMSDEWEGIDNNREYSCKLWCDILEPRGAGVLAQYGENFYQGAAAVTVNFYGKGNVYYNGTVLERKGMISFAKMIVKASGLEYVEGLPWGVERSIRGKNNKRWHFLFNNTEVKQEFEWRVIKKGNTVRKGKSVLHPFEMSIYMEES